MEWPVPRQAMPAAKVRRISIKNYKGIDDVELQLPGPRMKGDPDVTVIGSENGLGKTSILECCSLLLSTLTTGWKQFSNTDSRMWPGYVPDLLIRAGAERFELEGEVALGSRKHELSFCMTRQGNVQIAGDKLDEVREKFGVTSRSDSTGEELMSAISGMSADPVVAESFLLFHSYRKVQEGNPELGMMAEDRWPPSARLGRRYDFVASHFKMMILRALMQQADLFESSANESADAVTAIERLNDLMLFYAGGTISKLRPRGDNTVEFRIAPNGGGESLTFDGLSSGQKEIISTLFLVWYHTQDRSSVVLIDDPELHLNAQWHRSFVKKLFELMPSNQYVLATHSTDVMDSVEEDRRVLLSG